MLLIESRRCRSEKERHARREMEQKRGEKNLAEMNGKVSGVTTANKSGRRRWITRETLQISLPKTARRENELGVSFPSGRRRWIEEAPA